MERNEFLELYKKVRPSITEQTLDNFRYEELHTLYICELYYLDSFRARSAYQDEKERNRICYDFIRSKWDINDLEAEGDVVQPEDIQFLIKMLVKRKVGTIER